MATFAHIAFTLIKFLVIAGELFSLIREIIKVLR